MAASVYYQEAVSYYFLSLHAWQANVVNDGLIFLIW